MDKLYSCETSPCLLCLTPVETNSSVNIELKTKNYQNIVACSRKFLKDKINRHYSESVILPDEPLPELCVKCFKCAEKIHKINKQLMELSKMLENLIEMSLQEINERISSLAPDGNILADEIKIEHIKEETDVGDILVLEMDLDDANAHLEEKSLLTSDGTLHIDQEITDSVSSPLQFLGDGEWDETDVDPLKADGTSNVNEECERSYPPSALLETKHEGVEDENECPICKKKFATPIGLNMHLKSHGNNVCDTCGSNFFTWAALREHRRTHVGNFECNVCGKKVISERDLEQHKNYMHRLTPKEKAKRIVATKCKICGQKVNSEQDLDQHKNCKHRLTPKEETKRIVATKCKICDHKRFNSSALLKKHLIHFHTAYTQQMSHCDQCGNKFLNGLELYKHNKKFNENDTVKCVHCKGIFESRCDLLIHVANSHPGQKIPYKCKVCGLVLSAPQFLSRHFNLECWKISPNEQVLEINRDKKVRTY